MADYHSQGNLSLSAGGDLTLLAVTCANIRTSTRSTMGHPFRFSAEWNTLLPLMNFIEEATCVAMINEGTEGEGRGDQRTGATLV